MGLSNISVGLGQYSKEKSLRLDFKYVKFRKATKSDAYTFPDIFEFSGKPKAQRLAEFNEVLDEFKYVEIGNTTKLGEVDPNKLKLSVRNELTEQFFKKIEKGDIQRPEENSILISKIRPNLKKYIYIDQELKENFYTTAFINVRPKLLNRIMYYSLRTVFYEELMAISRQGKGYPTLKEDDLKDLRFEKDIISRLQSNSDKLESLIDAAESKIKSLKTKLKSTPDVINAVFSRDFNFKLNDLFEREMIKHFSTSSALNYRNSSVRSSVRWNKIEPLQALMYKNINYVERLGKYIVSTKNGWSPVCKEADTDYYVYGVDSINQDAIIKNTNLKTSSQERSGIQNYYAKEGDFFVSRGNTVDLVALASIVRELPEDKNVVYPDLFIKLTLDETSINPEYLAYVFNSVIGRFYFKYATKGKNQTMVKISGDELQNFYLPIPPLELQNTIVAEIKEELSQQSVMRHRIELEREKVESAILEVLRK